MPRTSIIPEKIVELLNKNHLLSVAKMQEIFESSGENYNKTSIYRSLEKLIENGEICKQNFSEQEAVYELRNNHHDHAVCTNCEKIVAVECESHLKKNVSGFNIDHHHTTLYDLCDNCSK